LKRAGVSTEVSQLSRLLHDKLAAIGGKGVITGSYNWTLPAENRKRENLILLECPAEAELYGREWEMIEINN